MKDPTIGEIVLYYIHGDVNQKPSVAVVVDVVGSGIVELMLIERFRTDLVYKRNVYPVGDERLAVNENLRLQYGCWETRDAYKGRLSEQERKSRELASRLAREREEVESRRRRTEPDDEQVVLAFKDEQNMNATEIAEHMTQQTGDVWSYQRVNAILRKHGRLVAT